MDIVRKEYIVIVMNDKHTIRFEGANGVVTMNMSPTFHFKKDDLEELMAAFNWLYHEVHGLPHKK